MEFREKLEKLKSAVRSADADLKRARDDASAKNWLAGEAEKAAETARESARLADQLETHRAAQADAAWSAFLDFAECLLTPGK